MLRLSEVKEKWHTVGLPHALFSRIGAVIKYTGHTSHSEYVRFAVQERLPNDEAQAESEKMMEKEIKARLEDAPFGDSLR